MSLKQRDQNLTQRFDDFYRTYYREEIGKLAQTLSDPDTPKSLFIEYGDLFSFDREIAEDYLDKPDEMRAYAEEALSLFDLPVDVDLSEANVRIRDTQDRFDDESEISISDLTHDHIGDLVAISGQIDKVTKVNPNLLEAHWECQRCGTPSKVPQGHTEVQEPHECQGCERQGPFSLVPEQSDWVDRRKLKLGELPSERTTSRGQHRPVYVEGDLCHYGGENGLADRAGDQATVYATVRVDEDQLTGQNAKTEADIWLEAHAVTFDDDGHGVEVEEHKEEFKEFAARENAIDLCAESIAPELLAKGDEEMETVMDAAVAWLFNGYRIDPDGLGTYRGDLHMAIIGDPGLGKSTLLSNLDDLAPKSVFRSGTGLSKVGLTAAAVQEEFAGNTEWTLEPGVLPRANGGHCIIDEVDDVVDEKTKAIHDALEGEQTVKVDKAGIEADLPSRAALLASGNPKHGRFDKYESIAEQVDLDPALISRMDVLLSIQDIPDPEHDKEVAEHKLNTWDESSRAELAERGVEVQQKEVSASEGPVPKDTLRAWVAYARENVFPVLTDPAKEKLREFYLETRDLNDSYEKEDSEDDAIPATPRALEAGIRLSTAYARVHLSKTVEEYHVERAISVSREVIGMHFDPDSGDFDAGRTDTGVAKSQRERVNKILTIISDLESDYDNGVPFDEAVERLVDAGVSKKKAKKEIENQRKKGELYEPTTDHYRTTEDK